MGSLTVRPMVSPRVRQCKNMAGTISSCGVHMDPSRATVVVGDGAAIDVVGVDIVTYTNCSLQAPVLYMGVKRHDQSEALFQVPISFNTTFFPQIGCLLSNKRQDRT